MGDEKESKHIKTRGKKEEKRGEIVRKESEAALFPSSSITKTDIASHH